jgi:type IV secretion system protein VirB5
MSTVFTGPPPRFAPGEAESRYGRQLAEMEARFTSTRLQIDGWRKIALILGGIAIMTTAGSVYFAAARDTAVHVVEIDRVTGEPLGHRLLDEAISVNDAVIAHTLARWIQMTRARSVDPVVLRQAWDDAYRFVPVTAKPAIDAYAREIDAFNPDRLGREAVAVAVASVTRQSEDSFQVRWTETLYREGQARSRQSYTANLAIAFIAPKEPRQIQVNPLGLMIASIHLQPDFQESAPRS